ncbi:hypothetical protein MTO96_051391 [Rhipicephalus appendiculatus]
MTSNSFLPAKPASSKARKSWELTTKMFNCCKRTRPCCNRPPTVQLTAFGSGDPRCSTVRQVSRGRVQFLNAIQDRIDAPHFFPSPDVLNELHIIAGHIRSKTSIKLTPFTFEQAKTVINKQSAAGMLVEWPNMQAFLDDPKAPQHLC